jgi:hypothetical protein
MKFRLKYLSLQALRLIFALLILSTGAFAKKSSSKFKVVAFYTGQSDRAHVSFVQEANRWFSETAKEYRFSYDSTNNWDNLNINFLAKYDVVLFLDTRPDKREQRAAFEQYMKKGGAWMGFHFAAFALTPSDFPQNWDWYHDEFLGSGEYKANTWGPTSAILRIETTKHPSTKDLPVTFKASVNEWYSWKNDLRKNPDIKVLISIDPSSFPLGTGPKAWEIWHDGDYPVVWTNTKYRMIYLNMGHNDIDYQGKTNKELSRTFTNPVQNHLVINCLQWLGRKH